MFKSSILLFCFLAIFTIANSLKFKLTKKILQYEFKSTDFDKGKFRGILDNDFNFKINIKSNSNYFNYKIHEMKIISDNYGNMSYETLKFTNDLANLYYDNKHYKAAEIFYKYCICIHEHLMIDPPIQKLCIQNNIALCFYKQKKYSEADMLLSLVVRSYSKAKAKAKSKYSGIIFPKEILHMLMFNRDFIKINHFQQ